MQIAGMGMSDEVRCLQDVPHKSPAGDDLCLGYRLEFYWLGLPAHVSDQGYVLVVKGTERDSGYYALGPALIERGQHEGWLPSPLPAYSLGVGTQLFGHSLWLALIVTALLGWRLRVRKRHQRVADAADATTPISDRVQLDTEGDRYLRDLFASQLRAGETVTHQAYGVNRELEVGGPRGIVADAASTRGVLAALTGERLILIETPVGDFGPKTNRVVEAIDRAHVRTALRDGKTLIVGLDDGSARTIVIDPRYKHLSNQAAFLRDVPRILGPAAPDLAVAATT
jgi:hypothetical protein